MKKNVATTNNIRVEKKNFLQKYGYQAYRKLYYMAKFFDSKIEKFICLSDDDINKLLK